MNISDLTPKDKNYLARQYQTGQTPNLEKLKKWLARRGFKPLEESGTFADVYVNSSKPYVIKVSFAGDKAYLLYAQFAKENAKSNPLLPRIHDIWHTEDMFLVVTEKLYECIDYEFVEMIEYAIETYQEHTLSPKDATGYILENIKQDYEFYVDWFKKNYQHVFAIAQFVNDSDTSLDLHIGNVMMRGENEFVITDPVT